jgi:hypothetical protein
MQSTGLKDFFLKMPWPQFYFGETDGVITLRIERGSGANVSQCGYALDQV